MRIEKISAVTTTVQVCGTPCGSTGDVLGMEIIYGGQDGCFSSLCAQDVKDPILTREQGNPVTQWGRMIFYVADVDGF